QHAYTLATDRGHRECHPVQSRAFELWLRHGYYKAHGKAPTATAVNDALNTLEGKARADGECHEVQLRVAHGRDGNLYIDLGDPDWRAVHVTPTSWGIVPTPPVYFRRSKGMRALLEPERGGSIDELWEFLNVPDSNARALILAWLAAALGDCGPHSVLALYGEQGSSKTTTARMLRALVDPAKADLRSNPHEIRDLAIAANAGWLVALDNVSHVEPWLSDALCRLSTGSGFATRALYTNDEEALFDAKRPVLLNGITEY